MINGIVLLSEADKDEYLSTCQNKIDRYSKDLELIISLFDKIRAKVPTSSYANFRDALFHFYKMKSLVDEIQMIKEIYAMEEHLNRSLKDTIIALFQNLSVRIEFLMQIKPIDNQKLYDLLDDSFKNLAKLNVYEIIQQLSRFQPNQYQIHQAAILFLLKFCEGELWKYCSLLREVLHIIKNECLSIRSISLSIGRPWESSNYTTKFYHDLFIENLDKLNKDSLLAFVPFSYYLNLVYNKKFIKKEI